MRKVLGSIRKADQDYQLIDENDKIAVGISGGKDSIVLLYGLYLYKKISQKNFDILAIHLRLGFEGMDMTPVQQWCDDLNIEFLQVDTDVYKILKIQANAEGRLPCSLCSKFKKGHVIDEALKHGCNKVAFAHHADDAVETLFLNMIYGGRIATFRPKMYLTRKQVTFIRPLLYVFENDIRCAVDNEHLPVVVSTCPMDKHTQREEIKQLLNQMYKVYPTAKDNFITMLSNQEQLDLWQKKK
ncbi:MAG: tRNA 2-thiocytidine(32) synthetase TtcA [Firmicutes bacterium HGW-Firmicutes-10]|jgi:tRNA(Ile)-lysidine synthase TilS/MesJ|nr:MAG: tRNA 2-thiocytidine(32) synthetase TtcA [Firmicutes bacterium HGW-Firmicutes-10]